MGPIGQTPGKRAAEVPQLTTSAAKVGEATTTDDGHAVEQEHQVKRYPVSSIDFERVETPFIIGVWILFASIAKIGKLHFSHLFTYVPAHVSYMK